MLFKRCRAVYRLFVLLIICSCNNIADNNTSDSNLLEEHTSKKAVLFPQNQSYYKIGDTLAISLQLLENHKPDSVQFLLDEHVISMSGLSAKVLTKNKRLGKHSITSILFFNGKAERLNSNIYLLADAPPKNYGYQVVNVYPHDTTAFTEGLEYSDGYLYESTGQYGNSELRKIEPTTGKVIKKIKLDKRYFGEGLTKFKQHFIQLTWKENTGFVYDADFNLIKTFTQNHTEGWGLCNDGEYLIKSDGSNKIYFLNPETYTEEKHLEVYDHQLPVRRINELEYVHKNIYANIWETNSIVIINPENGQVTGIINVAGILNMYTKPATIDVLNGIAYDQENNRLFITGKNWPKVFEIKVTAN